MTTYEPFSLLDMFRFNFVNTDKMTETFRVSFYADYIIKHGKYGMTALHGTSGTAMGYILGKEEGEGRNWHSHISAITVGEPFRKMGLARTFMETFESISQRQKANFADLFVRASNAPAVTMYEKFGYTVYRRVRGYYMGGDRDAEDALDMRKVICGDLSCLVAPKTVIDPGELQFN